MALKKLLTNLEAGKNAYPNHNTPSNIGGFNYDKSTSMFENSFTFNQKSFTFKNGTAFDQPGGGYSNEPFIKNDIPEQLASNPAKTDLRGDLMSGVPNSLIRGGTTAAVNRRLEDVSRITKFLISSKGISFIARQVGLQLSNPRIDGHTLADTSDVLGDVFSGDFSGLAGVANNLIGSVANQRTYNPLNLNLLAQVAAQGTGLHIKREGLLPTATKGYIDSMDPEAPTLDGPNLFADYNPTYPNRNTNRMISLWQGILKTEQGDMSATSDEPTTGFGKFMQGAKETFKKTSEFLFGKKKHIGVLYDYAGGPGSVYGIGKTTIKRYTATGLDKTGTPLIRVGDSYKKDAAALSNSTKGLINYLSVRNKPFYPYHATTADGVIRAMTREERIGLGNPGVGVGREDEGRPDTYVQQTLENGVLNYNYYDKNVSTKRIDKINNIDIFRLGTGDYSPSTRDMIKFRFEAVDTDNPTQSDVMVFRAFLDTFTDNFNANHNEYQYNGRGEIFYTYNNFRRTVNIGFKIAAQTRWEMMPLYRKLNYLVSNVAPEYGRSGRMRTPFMKVSVGSYLSRTPGILNNVNITWQKDYPWEIALDSPEQKMDTHMIVLPHVLDVTLQFTPIHNFLPQKNIHAPFILPHKNDAPHLNPLQEWYKLGVATSPAEANEIGFNKLGALTTYGEVHGREEAIGLDPVPIKKIETDTGPPQLPPRRPLEPSISIPQKTVTEIPVNSNMELPPNPSAVQPMSVSDFKPAQAQAIYNNEFANNYGESGPLNDRPYQYGDTYTHGNNAYTAGVPLHPDHITW